MLYCRLLADNTLLHKNCYPFILNLALHLEQFFHGKIRS